MLIYENRKAKLLNILKIGINPFKKFVATGEIKEELGFVSTRKNLTETIIDIIKNNKNTSISHHQHHYDYRNQSERARAWNDAVPNAHSITSISADGMNPTA